MEVIDLTHKIEEDMITYTEDTKPMIKEIAKVLNDGYNEKSINIFSHTGTHMDAPYHMIENGMSLDKYDISKFIGEAVLIDISNSNTKSIEMNVLEEYEEAMKSSEFIIIRTGWDRYWNQDEYFRGFPTLTEKAAKWIAELDIKGIGVDTISVDKSNSIDFEVHNIILGSDKIILENLTNLELIKDNKFELIATPLKYSKADGSPVRAIAILR